jgi:histidinol-phosphate aminotransferase
MSAREKVKRWIRPSILAASVYKVPDADGLIKLDAMENPYTWPGEIKRAWLDELWHIDLNRYPDAGAGVLKERLREVMAIPPSVPILLGNGSDEIIQILVMAMAQQGSIFLAPEPGFVMYRVIAEAIGAKFIGVPLREDFSLDRSAMLVAIEQQQPALIFLAWPNNPTGNLFDRDSVHAVIEAAPGLVVMDEAYYAFAGESFLDCLGRYDNLLVMRTLSKLGLAGLRLGILAGSETWLDELEKVRLPYNISTLTQKSVEFICRHIHVLDQQVQQIQQDRDRLLISMVALPHVHVWPSQANFVLFRVENKDANSIYTGLKNRGVLIKNLHGSHPMLQDCLRVTVGTEKENSLFMGALSELVS